MRIVQLLFTLSLFIKIKIAQELPSPNPSQYIAKTTLDPENTVNDDSGGYGFTQ